MEHFEKDKTEERTGFFKWAAITSKYFVIAMIEDSLKNSDISIEGYSIERKDKEGKKEKVNNFNISWSSNCERNSRKMTMYTGPTKLAELKAMDVRLEKVMFKGYSWFFMADKWFPYLCEFVLWLLNAMQNGVKDYGVAIILITIISRVVTFPLTHSSMSSMSKMKDVKPKMDAIRQRYKSNPRKMNEEIMALYKKEKVNPMNPGCFFPMLIQFPIMISLFVVLRKAIELRGAGTVLVPWIHDLSRPEALFSVAGILPGFIRNFYGDNFALVPVIMGVLTFFQNKMTMKDPSQKSMVYIMPVIMTVLFNNFPSGLVIYWTFSSALGIVQQYTMNKLKKE